MYEIEDFFFFNVNQVNTRATFVKSKIVLQSNDDMYELPILMLLQPANMDAHRSLIGKMQEDFNM